MSKTKELIICLISVAILILAVTTNVFASDLNELLGDANSTSNNYSQISEVSNNSNTNSTSINNITNTNNTTKATTNNSNSTNTTIPYTGVDYSVVLIIAICGISAIYAYKKIRDYNI